MYNEISITIKKISDSNQINMLHQDVWIDHNIKIKTLCAALYGEEDDDNKSIKSTSMYIKIEGP